MIDSATLFMHYGVKLHIVEGPSENIKITTPSDYFMFKGMLEIKENMRILGV
jgi:2-C-methyl-D-erythritol 4-phosphate cytidylyltransferase